MAGMIPYLVFPGTCKEAMKFYAQVLNGEIITMKTFSDSPIEVPNDYQNRIFDSELNAEKIRIKASDDLPNHSVTIGNNISLFLSFTDKAFREEVFKKLSASGKILFPLEKDFGMVKDKFDIQWMLVTDH